MARDRQRCRSNIAVLILDSAGKLVHSFDGLPEPGNMLEMKKIMPVMLQVELAKAELKLGRVPPPAKRAGLALPTAQGDGDPAGVRVYLKFGKNHLEHFKVPVVEAVPITKAEREALKWGAERRLSVDLLRNWLKECYPPAVMDGMGGFRGISGELTWKPAGQEGAFRYAILSGTVRFELDNTNRAKYEGPLELALRYRMDRPDLLDLEGVLPTVIPRQNPQGQTVERVTMDVAFESLPAAGREAISLRQP